MYTRAEYDLFGSRNEICLTVLYELNAEGLFCFWMNNDPGHRRQFGQVKVCSVANRSEEGFIGANSVTVSQIRLQSRKAYQLVAVVID
jgi:hypothetical protein